MSSSCSAPSVARRGMKTVETDWENLVAPYFADVCKSVLGPYFSARGFALSAAMPHRVTYRRGRCVVDLYHYPEDSPRYTLMLSIGWRPRFRSYCRERDNVGVWRAPHANDVPEQWLLDFRTPEELESVLGRAREFLELYARPLWEEPKRLRRLIDQVWQDRLREQREGPPPRESFRQWSRRVGSKHSRP